MPRLTSIGVKSCGADKNMAVLPILLGFAVLLPLLSFVVIFLVGPRLGEHGKTAGTVAVLAIFGSLCLSLISLGIWLWHHPPQAHHAEHAALAQVGHAEADHANGATAPGEANGHAADATSTERPEIHGEWYTLGKFGKLRLTIGYYIDALTVAMFSMVSFIALCIHVYATGYMHDELHDVTDHEVHLRNGRHLHRPGRFPRFFQFLSLFTFSMLGLVIAGNVLMTFVFWELVGICSYFLIGFYVERPSASTAANKAFIVNRVGDFGMIIGLMALWGSLGTLSYGDPIDGTDRQPGIFSQIRPPDADHALTVPASMTALSPLSTLDATGQATPESASVTGHSQGTPGYGLLVVAGLGIFAGCVGKSAQFPLHVWLPDAMEGPTPVSALVHSATMVAAGVFLVARIYPIFTPEVLLTIACVGAVTVFLAATIAVAATDIKRVLAYSTLSQLGYMMMALGVGGWLAGVLHLFTHAFFKSLLFLCSGSVIHAVHTNELPQMGGLARKMPWTAFTMLIGCLAISGAGIPLVIGLSGYYSKDSILEQAYLYGQRNPGFGSLFFHAAVAGATMTSFYMFRLWYLAFAGEPRDSHRYDHAHESPREMVVPLVVLAVLSVIVAWGPRDAILGAVVAGCTLFGVHLWRGIERSPRGETNRPGWLAIPLGICAIVFLGGLLWNASSHREVTLANLLEQARPEGTLEIGQGVWTSKFWPNEMESHAASIKVPVTLIAISAALGGMLLATVFYFWRTLNADDVRRQFPKLYHFLLNKWWFDEIYDWIFIRPAMLVSHFAAGFDRRWIDGCIDRLAAATCHLANFWERVADRAIVDRFFDGIASWTHGVGLLLRNVQTGSIRQYVMFIVVGMVAVFVVISFFWGYAFASLP